MTETATFAPINAPISIEEFKAFFIRLLEEDASFRRKIKEKSQKKEKKAKKKVHQPLPPAIPFSEMPYRKLHPDFVAIDVTPYAISAEALKRVQEAWRDMPSAEELVAQLSD